MKRPQIVCLALLVCLAMAAGRPHDVAVPPVARARGLPRQATWTVCPAGPPACDYAVIQEAVDAAGHGDVIKVAAGVYTDVNSYGGLALVVYLDKSITIRGGYDTDFTEPPDPMANPTTLDAQGQGRVLYITGAVSPTVEGLRLTGGHTTGDGGGVCVISAMATLRDNWVFNNTADHGGGLYLYSSPASLTANSVSGNDASRGGGLYLAGSDATLSGNTISGNDARKDGGGLYLDESDASLEGNNVTANTAIYGGGLYLDVSDATLTNNVVADNLGGSGSGLRIEASSPHLLHTTIARNRDGSGVLTVGNSTVILTNTILVSHTMGVEVAAGSTVILEGTLWGSGAWANGTDWGGAGTIVTGTVNLWGEPAFVDPDAGDYHIGPDSAAIDAGVDAGVVTDIDGEPRPAVAGYDIGADELPAALRVTKQAAPDPVPPGARLTYTLCVTNVGSVTLTAAITDVLPAQVTPTGVLTWTAEVPFPGGVWTQTVVVTVELGYAGRLTNVVQVTTGEGAAGTATCTVTVAQPFHIYLPIVDKPHF